MKRKGPLISQEVNNLKKLRHADYEGGHVIKDSKGNGIMTREYPYTNNREKKIIVQDHSAGH
ncbi:HNH/endonuclease VII fold putative polymorphic toxin [Salipaludibacillus sp. LMS25]|jgi:hypothetical protein|uniref:HNH/endonuclease VII fold putative polymorphic toxin n=1 Tax=Salipaludibacillus sp. LMS25 TaxID=2924031 RepID=UPI0020D13EDC|nr:HNH/endonuclease VII fold putative polymorphic toxin [Salipaludibacillus sp. LMS25]UTR13953.1 HNH/endonuclease VII fold putative polymorphic toxin [Salipaludibacillus sp. LMS25]